MLIQAVKALHRTCRTLDKLGSGGAEAGSFVAFSQNPASSTAILDAGKLPGRPATVTVFGPPEQRSLLEHTARFVPLVVAVFEALLGCRLPYPALHVVRASIKCGSPSPYTLLASFCWVEDA